MNKSFVSQAAMRLNAAASIVAPQLLPGGHRSGSLWRAGNVAGEPGQSLFVYLTGDRAGRWKDMASGEGGDLLNLIALQRGCSLVDAVKFADELLGNPDPDLTPSQPAPQRRKKSPDHHAAAQSIWNQTVPIGGTHGAAYLAARGIDAGVLDGCDDLRFAPELRARDGGQTFVLPAMVAAVRNAHGVLTGVHRTFLSSQLTEKANITDPKQALGHLHGSGVLLAAPSSRAGKCLVIAEGIETALSIKAAFPGVALIAALTAPHMALLNVPAHFTRIAIAADPDMAGLRAAAALANRLIDAGRTARIIIPHDPHDEQADFNDLLRSGGVAGVKALVKSQMKSTI